MNDCLPFGDTSFSAEHYWNEISFHEVERHLSERGISNHEERVTHFANAVSDLAKWLDQNGRKYPWRETREPWRVYVSEILLQRTRADAVEAEYNQFFEAFPDPEALHIANSDRVRERVYSLGFGNQRVRSLKDVSEHIINSWDGSIPRDVEKLKKPWRVGAYSARATMLFAFGVSSPLVDANIARIVERFFPYRMPLQPHKNTDIYNLMGALTPSDPCMARAFYLGLLDLGAKVCVEENPGCDSCPLALNCAYSMSWAESSK